MSASGGRLGGNNRYPWYDSWWLAKYAEAQAIIRRRKPEALPRFLQALAPLQTSARFRTTLLDQPFDAETIEKVRRAVRDLRPTDLDLQEARGFGRFVVRDHPLFHELQARAAPIVSAAANEPVEPSYTFLSLYSTRGVCPVHLDAPKAKWTLDLCIDQSGPWPIYISEVHPWPAADALADFGGEDWQETTKQAPGREFSEFSPGPGQAILFSGSSQWHYRDPIPTAPRSPFCTLLFLHFIPQGTANLLEPRHWADLVNLPELATL